MKKILLISLVIMVLNTCITSGLQNNNINEVEVLRLEMFEMKNVVSTEAMPEYSIPLDKKLQEYTYQMCQEQGVQYETVLGLLYLESEFDEECKSYNGRSSVDRGIAQINNIYQDYHVDQVGMTEFNPYDPYHSIELCVKLLKPYYDYWIEKGYSHEQAEILMLGTYNKGQNGITEYIKEHGKIETPYSNIIIKYKNNLLKYGSLKEGD